MDYQEINEKLLSLREYFRNEIRKGNFESQINKCNDLQLSINNFLFFFEKVGDVFFQRSSTIDLDISFNEEFDQIFQNEYEKLKKK